MAKIELSNSEIEEIINGLDIATLSWLKHPVRIPIRTLNRAKIEYIDIL